MQLRIKKFAALMMAVMLVLGASSAFAQELKPDMRTSILNEGKNIKTQMRIEVDQVTLSSLLNMFGMGAQEPDSGEQAAIDTMLNALNKMKFTSLQNLTSAYMSMGTDKGELLDVLAQTDLQTGEAGVTSSLMPGIKFSVPQDLFGMESTASYDDLIKSHNMQKISAWAESYLAIFNSLAEERFGKDYGMQTGTFEVIDQGSFDQKMSLLVDTYLVAALMEAFLPTIKEDKIIKEHIDVLSSAPIAQAGDMEVSQVKFDEFIQELEKGLAKIKSESNEIIAKVDVYSNANNEAMYLQAELIDKGVPMALISLNTKPGKDQNDMHLSFLMTQNETNYEEELPAAGEATEEATEEPEAQVDWAALRESVLAGANAQGILLDMTVAEQKNQAENKQIVSTRINMFLMGLNVGFAVDSDTSLSGKYESESSFAISFLSPLPLITVYVSESETDEALPEVESDGLKEVVLSEEMSEEDTALLEETLKSVYPELLEKLGVAMPEEAALLTVILGGAMNEAIPQEEPQTVTP